MRHFSLTDIRAVDVRGTQLPKAISEDRVRQSVFDVLDSSLLCSMATVTPDGNVHISTAYFSFSYQLELFFWSHPEALHCRNVRDNGSMAMTIFSTQQPWGSPGRGVQLFGTCRITSGASADEAERSYGRRFDGYDDCKTTISEGDLARRYRFYQFDVSTLKVLDEKNLGDGLWVRAAILRHWP
jgi:uncharacterized protein YhbP (UPF0306 family)